MLTIRFTSLKSAEKNGAERPYLALLVPGMNDAVDRKFVKSGWDNQGKTRRLFEANAQPGDIFECRRWQWDMDRLQYFGGTVWLGVQRGGDLMMLTREEAHRAVLSHRIDGSPAATDVLALRLPSRIVPDDIRCDEWLENKQLGYTVKKLFG